MNGTDGLRVHVSWFEAAILEGRPAFGLPETLSWADVASIIVDNRRIGEKDGPNFVPARFALEGDGRHVRRLGRNVAVRTMIALDCETDKKTGEVPPAPHEVVTRLLRLGLASVVYTSHSHIPDANPRYRVVVPLAEEIAPDLPASEVLARQLDLSDVLDLSKRNAASLFYLPSAACFDDLEHHEAYATAGQPYDAAAMREKGGALLAERQAKQDRLAAEAHAEAQTRLHERIAAGFDPDDSLIEKLRGRFDLRAVLLAHGYDQQGNKFRHSNSMSGSFGADIKVLGGIERIYSHNGTDPLHRDNLPDWCGGVTALDAFDVVAILDFGGDRGRALRELAQRFGITKAEERKTLSRLVFKMIRQQAPQEAIEASAFAEGLRLGLTRLEVCQVAQWVASQALIREAA